MRILHTTDLHFNLQWYDWLTERVPAYDVICISGDLLSLFDMDRISLRHQVRSIQKWIREFPGRLIVCTGNHDWWRASHGVTDVEAMGGWLNVCRRPDKVFTDGDATVIGNIRFIAVPWATPPEIPASALQTIVVCHSPPAATAVSQDVLGDHGDEEVRQAAWQLAPGSLILSGHAHQPRRWYAREGPTYALNPGANKDACEPNYILIDTTSRRATIRAASMVRGSEVIRF